MVAMCQLQQKLNQLLRYKKVPEKISTGNGMRD
jgi:hypothetical protein